MLSHNPRLTATLARLATLIPGAVLPAHEQPQEAPGGPAVSILAPAPAPALAKPLQACYAPTEPPAARVLASFQGAEEVAQGVSLTRGAHRLWSLLHRLALDVARARSYVATPDQVVFHVPAVTLAGVLDYHADHVARLGRELERAGLLDFGGHAQAVLGRSMWDGCLWAVKTRTGVTTPRVRAEEWRHVWRPDFAADVEGRTGAAAELSGLKNAQATEEELYRAAQARAAVPVGVSPPATSSPDNPNPAGLHALAERIPGLWNAHARRRAAEVGKLASAMCAALCEPERRRYWCRVLWEAIRAQYEGRQGLQVLAAQVARLAADLREGAPWRNAGAVLAARLR